MYKSNTTRQKLHILCCLSPRPQNGGRGGGACFNFWPIGGAFIRRGAYSRGGGGANSRIYGNLSTAASQSMIDVKCIQNPNFYCERSRSPNVIHTTRRWSLSLFSFCFIDQYNFYKRCCTLEKKKQV